MIRTILPALLALAAPLAMPLAAEDRALVIGIDDYAGLGDGTRLNGAVGDARRVAHWLVAEGGFAPDAVTLLTDAEAGAEAILDATIDGLIGGTGPGDRAVLYFAGLGQVLSENGGADATPALVAHDGGDSLLGLIPLDLFAELSGLMAGREVVVILDASFDGDPTILGRVTTRGRPAEAALKALPDPAPGGPTIWIAAGPGQYAWEDVDRGVFTEALLSGLTASVADGDGDGRITNGEMLEHVHVRSDLWCTTAEACAARARPPVPVLIGDPEGLFLAAAPPAPDPVPDGFEHHLAFVTENFAGRNSAGLTLAIRDAAPLRIGDQVQFAATARAAGELVVLDLSTDGRLRRLFPTALSGPLPARLEPGQELVLPRGTSVNGLPLRVTVSGPPGDGLLLGLLVESAAGLPNLDEDALPVGRRLIDLAAALDAMPGAWSAIPVRYRIEP